MCSCFFLYATVFLVGLCQTVWGSLVSNTFRHVRPGAWWVGVVLMTCPFASLYLLEVRRFYFSLLLAILTAAIAFLGAFLDARISLHFSSFTACASKGEIYPFKDMIYSGKSSDYLVAQSCFNSTEFIEYYGCYCVSNDDPRTCTEYVRSGASTSSYNSDTRETTVHTCYDTLTFFSESMTGSCVLCCLGLLMALLQIFFLSFSRWKCRQGRCSYEGEPLEWTRDGSVALFFTIYPLF